MFSHGAVQGAVWRKRDDWLSVQVAPLLFFYMLIHFVQASQVQLANRECLLLLSYSKLCLHWKKLCLHWIVNGFSSVTCRRSHYKWPKSLQSRGQYFVSLISSCFLFYMEKLAMLYNYLLKPVQVWLLFSTMFQYSNCFSLTPQTQLYFSCF